MNAHPAVRLVAAAPLQVFEGKDGAKVPGFEAFHRSTLHTSPLLYDIDFDGVADIVAATYDGEILFFKDTVRGGRAQEGGRVSALEAHEFLLRLLVLMKEAACTCSSSRSSCCSWPSATRRCRSHASTPAGRGGERAANGAAPARAARLVRRAEPRPKRPQVRGGLASQWMLMDGGMDAWRGRRAACGVVRVPRIGLLSCPLCPSQSSSQHA